MTDTPDTPDAELRPPDPVAVTVYVVDPVDGMVRYLPGDVPTPEHAEMITNPRAWASLTDSVTVPDPPDPTDTDDDTPEDDTGDESAGSGDDEPAGTSDGAALEISGAVKVPDGNVEAVVVWMTDADGDTKARAAAVVESEEAKKRPRKSLVAAARALLG